MIPQSHHDNDLESILRNRCSQDFLLKLKFIMLTYPIIVHANGYNSHILEKTGSHYV